MPAFIKRAVVEITPSITASRSWDFRLECGHTSTRRRSAQPPQIKFINCGQCGAHVTKIAP